MRQVILLTPAETALELRTTTSTLATWRCQGKGPAFVKLGDKVLYEYADLHAYLAGRRQEQSAS
jgi:hypothetical protein